MFTARELSRRDPAMLALMGVSAGADFGFDNDSETSGFAAESRYSDSGFSRDRGFEPEIGWEATGAEGFFGADGGFFGFDAEGDFGGDFGADAVAAVVPKPTERQALALWHAHAKKSAKSAKRHSMLHPNKGVDTKVERYQLNISQTFAIGTATVLNALTKQPDTELRAQRILANVPVPVLVFYSEIKVANVSATIGGSNVTDAYDFSAVSVGQALSLPTITPQNKVTVNGNYTGLIPPGLLGGATATFIASFKGWAEMAG